MVQVDELRSVFHFLCSKQQLLVAKRICGPSPRCWMGLSWSQHLSWDRVAKLSYRSISNKVSLVVAPSSAFGFEVQ